MYLASEKGKRVLNFCYSWGASIVIIGALFKLLHLPYGNQILFVAMTVEALVFFISAFEKPFNEYHWEEVFPVLKSKNPLDRPDFANTPMSNLVNSPENTTDDEVAGGLNINLGGKQTTGLGNLGLDVSEEDTKNLSDSIKKLSAAAEQISEDISENISKISTVKIESAISAACSCTSVKSSMSKLIILCLLYTSDAADEL